MARPKKQSLDYFPLDVGALGDPKLIAPRQEFGYLATTTYLALLCMIYRDKGYYLRYDDETRASVTWTLTTEFLAGKYQPNPDTVAQVITRLSASGLFSGDLFRRGILTSKRIQETYYSATLDRKSISINWDFWILSENEMRELSSRSIILSNFIIRSKNPSYSTEKPSYSIESHQKEKESKYENISEIMSERKPEEMTDFLFSYRRKFSELFGTEPTRSHLTGIQNLYEAGRSDADILSALDFAASRKPDDPEPYVYVVVRDYNPTGKPKSDLNSWTGNPDEELKEWEKEWLEKIRMKQEEDYAEQSNPDGSPRA